MADRAACFLNLSNAAPYAERPDATPAGTLDRWLLTWQGRAMARWGSRGARAELLVDAIMERGETLDNMSDAMLQEAAMLCRSQLVQHGMSDASVIEAFALAREATRRVRGFRHHRVQLLGGLMMLDGFLAEMETGEGKTITALLPAATMALSGRPVHVVTVNGYLAARDAAELRPIYAMLGLTVGLVEEDFEPEARRRAYACDVTYCTNKDLVFDYLRDRLALGQQRGRAGRLLRRLAQGEAKPEEGGLLLRGLSYAIVDEADSVLIDEARTPLILSAEIPGGDEIEFRQTAIRLARGLTRDVDFRLEPRARRVELLEPAAPRTRAMLGQASGLWASERARVEAVSQALVALHLYRRDVDYIVDDGKVQIVDEYTGRVMPDRSWENGLHQMIEVKEGCAPTGRRKTIARITYQRFFRRYLRLAGMTGTIAEAAGEVYAAYGLRTVRIPTNRAQRRLHDGRQICLSEREKWAVVAMQARRQAVERKRPVLVGTRSVGASEALSAVLDEAGLGHVVLNARQDRDEAEIIAQAGRPGQITVATNMAGRGTDIKLTEAARDAGGLHVILTEYHESPRIDRQLFGRCGRQGDPGSFEEITSLEDEIYRKFGMIALGFGRTLLEWRQSLEMRRRIAFLLRRIAQNHAERVNIRVRQQTVLQDRQMEQALSFAGKPE